jgi:TatD DNase family protein
MPPYEYIDIHSHLNFEQFDSDRDEIIAQLKTERIATIAVGTTVADSRMAIELAEKHPHLFATIGIHPTHEWTDKDFDELEKLAAHPKVVAIGECGLDFFRSPNDNDTKMHQGQAFARHIEIALKYDKPLMIHCRNAYDETLSILEAFRNDHKLGDRLRGNLHFYAGGIEATKNFLASSIPFTFSFDGPITFARDYDEVIRLIPLERIMSETDAPFAAPAPFRGKRNQPLYVKEIAHKIAEIRGDEVGLIKQTLVQNAVRTFGLV